MPVAQAHTDSAVEDGPIVAGNVPAATDLDGDVDANGYDLSQFPEASVEFQRTEEGLLGLPLANFPAFLYYRPEHFDEAGLEYPAQRPTDTPEQSELSFTRSDSTHHVGRDHRRRFGFGHCAQQANRLQHFFDFSRTRVASVEMCVDERAVVNRELPFEIVS